MNVLDLLDRAAARGLSQSALDDPYAAILPTPVDDDDFFLAPADVSRLEPGDLVRTRQVRGLLPRPRTRLRQFMVRSTDARGLPVAVTATLMEPKAPWTGSGPRPVLVHNVAIDALGTKATASYRIVHGLSQDFPTVVPLWLARGYAVLIPDHEGPRMAYAEGTMAGQAVLDAVRGLAALDASYRESPTVLYGYSGGAIATVWAAQLQPSYAPELTVAGAIAGGTPTDFTLLRDSMNGTTAAGLLGAATIGIAREHPEMVELFGPSGLWAATRIRNLSVVPLALGGLARIRLEQLSIDPDAFESEIAQRVIAQNMPGAAAPSAPFAFYHGSRYARFSDRWIPERGALELAERWRALGATVEHRSVVGDHFVGAVTGLPFVLQWVHDRFRGRPVA